MERFQKKHVADNLEHKMVFVTGPRQVGKTTLAKSFSDRWPDLYHLNFDDPDHKQIFLRREWDRTAPLVVLDEVHKWPRCKTLLNGVYDTQGIPPRLLVTGSAHMDAHRRGGDSLLGRYLLHRLLPLSVAELKNQLPPAEALEQLLHLGGFPEPFLRGSEREARRWRTLYLERLVKEDFRDYANVNDIQLAVLLVELLRERVGSPLSFASLARDLQVSPHTVKRWIGILEALYVVFRVPPHHRNVARSILKSPKIYFYDCAMVRGDPGAILENLVAVSLLKAALFTEDVEGLRTRVHYIRDKEAREVDFAVVQEGKVDYLVEVKVSDPQIDRSLRRFASVFPEASAVQLVQNLSRARTVDGIQVEPAADWLAKLPL